jgi:septum formation protein
MIFEVLPAEIDETLSESEQLDPADAVIGLAEAKARKVYESLGGGDAIVIGADTIVVIDGQVLGKPVDPDMAAEMIGMLSGRTHMVFTGVAVIDGTSGRIECGVEETLVTMAALKAETIGRYVATGEAMDKAGAYAVQGLGSLFIERIEGCYFNVVGLPLPLLDRLLLRLGVDVAVMWDKPGMPAAEDNMRTMGETEL